MNNDLDSVKIIEIYDKLNTISKTITLEDRNSTERIIEIIQKLFNTVDGKCYIRTESKSITVDGSVKGYTINRIMLIEYINIELPLLVEDLTMSYWRTILKRQDFTTMDLVKIIRLKGNL